MALENDNQISDAITATPEVHTVLFENEKVRVFDVKVSPGIKTQLHWHLENVSYVLAGSKLQFSYSDNTAKVVELTAGQVTTSGEGAHMVENIGSTEVHVVQVELKI